MIPASLQERLREFHHSGGRITVLTGAGISAESGIPTFRGQEGYWQIGSSNYQPQEMATWSMFNKNAMEVWKWYLYRRTVCNKAQPNPGHYAVKKLEDIFGDRFALVSQNVDGLHLRAGNSIERSFFIHGNLEYTRCSAECSSELYPFPEGIGEKDRNSHITLEEWELLKCPKCGEQLRPHILWFDEYYNEEYYKLDTVRSIANKTSLLLVAGTSGATNLPNQVVNSVISHDGLVVDINPFDNVFAQMARASNGYALQGPAGEVLPGIVSVFESAKG